MSNRTLYLYYAIPSAETLRQRFDMIGDSLRKDIQHPRDGKTVYIGQTFRDVTYPLPDNREKTVGIRTVYEITERTIDRHGQYFIVWKAYATCLFIMNRGSRIQDPYFYIGIYYLLTY